MNKSLLKNLFVSFLAVSCLTGCSATYRGVIRPEPKLSILSPDLTDLSERNIEMYLKTKVKPVFPATLAVAKVKIPYYDHGADYQYGNRHPEIMVLENLQGDEALGWQKLTELKLADNRRVIQQVHFLSPMLVDGMPTLKKLRDAAAVVHAPLLLVYIQQDDVADGYNNAGAGSYWTLFGMLFVPGNTVGSYNTCQAILVDTQTGAIMATAQSDDMREEKVMIWGVDEGTQRVRSVAKTQSLERIQQNCRTAIIQMAVTPQ
jgi:hypothetical protein